MLEKWQSLFTGNSSKNEQFAIYGKDFQGIIRYALNIKKEKEVSDLDTVKMGKFLKELRKEKGFTQEQLGEKIGVTNKTVSRWENGNYIPPAECLVMLSDMYGISINEILSGQKLTADEFSDVAEDNLIGALELSEQSFKKSNRTLAIMWVVSTALTMLIIFLLPTTELNLGYTLLLIFLVAALGFMSNTVNFIALVLNKEMRKKQ